MKQTNSSVFFKWVGLLGCSLALIQAANAQTVRLHGAVALAKFVESKKAAVEAQSGVKLEVVGNGAGRGLADLAAGQADLALLAGPLKGVAEAMNKEKAGSVDSSQMKESALSGTKVAFITHSAVGVKALSEAQTRDVLTGKIANWKEVGGADLPVKLVLPFGADGTRVTVQNALFPGVDYSKNAVVRNSAKDISTVVSQLPGAGAVVTVQNVEGNVATVALEKDILVSWALVSKAEPVGDVKKVIDAITSLSK